MAIFIELFLLGVGLSMDAFAVSVCKGLGMRKLNKKQAVIIGLYFGGFQSLMPLIGWLLGSQFQKYITSRNNSIKIAIIISFSFLKVCKHTKNSRMQQNNTDKCLYVILHT